MSSESTIFLVKDYLFELTSVSSQGWMSKNFKAKEATLSKSPISGSSYVNALAEYIKVRSPDYPLLTFSAKVNRFGKTDFNVLFTENFVKRLCGIFPSRFIQVRGKIAGSGNGRTVKFDERFELNDLLEGFTLEQTLVHGTDCKNGNFTCDIIIGWSDTARRSFAAKFPINNADDWRIITGDGAEIKCPRSVVEALFGGRIEMKENSEEGIHCLIQYLSNTGLKINELTCEVAVELFKTSGKYQLKELEDSLTQLFLRKGRHWFTPDDLVELYFHAKNDNWMGLPDHLLTIMLSSSQEIRKCKRFEELSSVDALDLTWSLCDIKIKQK